MEINIFTGENPRIIGATVYALNHTFFGPPRPLGKPETVARVLDGFDGLIETVEGNVYRNGGFGITRFGDE